MGTVSDSAYTTARASARRPKMQMQQANYVLCGAVTFVLFLCSGLGVYIPCVSRFPRHHMWPRMLSAMSAGAVLSVAWLHLLDDAQDMLDEVTDYPAANAAMLMGFLTMALVHALAPCAHGHVHVAKDEPLLQQEQDHDAIKQDVKLSNGACHVGAEGQQILRFHLMEASISLHSVLIGLALGLTVEWKAQLGLAAALCVHQFLEGVALGMVGRNANISRRDWLQTFAVFCLSLPLGVAVAVTLQLFSAVQEGSAAWDWGYGLTAAFAAGTLTHIGAELIGIELSAQHHREHDLLPGKTGMVEDGTVSDLWITWMQMLGACVGAFLLAVLAIWA